MLNSNLGGSIPGYMGESGVKATYPTDPHLSDPHAAANESRPGARALPPSQCKKKSNKKKFTSRVGYQCKMNGNVSCTLLDG